MSTITATEKSINPARGHLTSLDGIRGFAAAYVLLHHGWLESGRVMPAGLHRTLGFLAYGQFAVAVFIVLSGYLLMLPVAKSTNGQLNGGIKRFATKRFIRIVPPYLAALIVSLALIWFSRHLHLPPTDFESIGLKSIVSHLLLLHNLSMSDYHSIDPPMWSVATEWQIYFVFAWLLLPIWRRVGTRKTVVAAFVLGLSPFALAKLHQPTFFWACPWYIGLFALGMCAACAQWSERPKDKALHVPWLPLAIGGTAAYTALQTLRPEFAGRHQIIPDILAGFAAMGLIGYCASFALSSKPSSPLVRLFQSSFADRLALFSYSLYLMHLPVLSFMARLLAMWLNGVALCYAIWIVAIPASVIASYVLYLLVERHCIRWQSTISR